jgi:exosortase
VKSSNELPALTFKNPFILPVLVFGLFIIAYFSTLELLVQKWAASDEYTHAFFTVPIIIYMLWQKRRFLEGSSGRSVKPSLALLILSLLLYILSLGLQIPTISFMTMVMTIFSGLIYLAGFRAVTKMATPLLLLLLIIPIPNQLYSMVTLPLQLQASQVSEVVIRLFGIPLFRDGNILHLPEKTFQVVEACSGLRSMITLLTLSLIIGYFLLRKKLSKSLLIAASMPVAFFVNIIRVVTMVLAFHFFQLDVTTGTAHTVMGVVIFVIALLMLFTLQRILEFWETEKKPN